MATATITEAWIRKYKLPDGVARERIFDASLPGFGVVIGARSRTFIARARVAGVRRDMTIGAWGSPGAGEDHSEIWTEPRARREALRLLGMAKSKVDPIAESPQSGAYTLQDGVDAHLARMKAKNRAARTIQTFEHETGKYLADWLDTPINDLDCDAIQEHVKASVSKRKGSVNKPGSMVANRVLAHVSASWRSLNRKLKGKLGTWNPAASTDKDKYIPSRKRVEDLPAWASVVASLHSPIRRDGLTLALYTGLRHEDVRTIRFTDVDFDAKTLLLPDPKGGEAKSFTIPLSKTPLEILRRRLSDNEHDIGADHKGWAFPALDQKGKVGPISNLRQQGEHNGTRLPVEDVHTLRRTWESIAHEEGVSELDQHVLSNHSFGSHNVNATYIAQHIDHLAECAAKIDSGITKRLKGKAKLRAA